MVRDVQVYLANPENKHRPDAPKPDQAGPGEDHSDICEFHKIGAELQPGAPSPAVGLLDVVAAHSRDEPGDASDQMRPLREDPML